jgi:hypothetical protein
LAGAAAFGNIEMIGLLASEGASFSRALDALGFNSAWSGQYESAVKILELEKTKAEEVIISKHYLFKIYTDQSSHNC